MTQPTDRSPLAGADNGGGHGKARRTRGDEREAAPETVVHGGSGSDPEITARLSSMPAARDDGPEPANPLDELLRLAHAIGERRELQELLQVVADGAALLTRSPRASLRLLNPMRTQLIAACRAGEPLHYDPNVVFTPGEGLIGWVAQHHRALRTGDADHDPRFLHRPDMKQAMGSFLGVPLLAASTCIGVVSAVHPEPNHFSEEHERLLWLLGAMAAPHVDVARLSQLSSTDRLTRARNRLGLERFLGEPPVADKPLSLLLVDVDHLGLVNERFGPAMGDEVLRSVTDRIHRCLEPTDVVFRFGGDELLVALDGRELPEAHALGERVCRAIGRSPAWTTTPSVTVTVSIGVASLRAAESKDELVRRAETALADAKRGGGNAVALAKG